MSSTATKPRDEPGTENDVPMARARRRLRRDWHELVVPVVFVLLIVVFSLLNENYLSFGNFTNILNQVSILAIVTVGASVVIFGGGFDLSAGSVVALSSVSGAMVMNEFGIVPAIAAAILVGTMVGALNGFVVGYFGVSPLIVTLGTLHAARGIALIISGGTAIYNLPPAWTDFGVSSFLGLPTIAWLALGIFIVFHLILKHTSYGMKVYAVGGNPTASSLSGVSVPRIKLVNFAIAGATAGLGGILLAARTAGGEPTAGAFYELEAIAAVILGGAALSGGEGKLWRSMMGITLLAMIGNGLNIVGIHPHWKGVAIGVILIGAASLDAIQRNRS